MAISNVRSSLAGIKPDEVQDELRKITEDASDLENKMPKLRGKLQGLAARLYDLNELKHRGIDAIPDTYEKNDTSIQLRNYVCDLLSDLQKHGLFLVPVGELESWLPVLMKGASRQEKSRWAMLAAEKIEGVGERADDVWQFVSKVSEYLQAKTEALATAPQI